MTSYFQVSLAIETSGAASIVADVPWSGPSVDEAAFAAMTFIAKTRVDPVLLEYL